MRRIGIVVLSLVPLVACGRSEKPAGDTASRRALRVALYAGTNTLDPNRLNERITRSILENMFESLITQDPDLKVVPGLAVGWETLNDRTWRVHLREGVKFHDGSKMKSVDVKFSYDRVLASDRSEFRNYLNSVDRVEIVDEYTVDIIMKRRYGLVANLGSIYILPSAYIQQHGEDYFQQHPVGTGPYRFESWRPGISIRMSAFDSYWKGRASFDEMSCVSIDSADDRVKALEEGSVDIAWMIPPRHAPPANYRVLLQPALQVFYLGLDCARKKTPYVKTLSNPFLDLRVRKAFLYAVDTNALIKNVFEGHAYTATQYVTPSVFGYNPEIPSAGFDPVAARRLLAEAGYPKGFQMTIDTQPSRLAVAQFLQSAYHQIGIDVQLNITAKDAFFDKLARRDTSAFVLGWSCTSGDASELYEASLHTKSAAQRLGPMNYSEYSDPAADALFEQSISTVDSRLRLELLQQTMATVVADVPWIPLYIGESSYGVSRAVRFSPRRDDYILGYDAQPAP